MDFFYYQQLRQYRLQVIRAFSNFYVSFGTNPDGSPNLHRVPCRYGDSSRLAETIISANSENKMPTTPFISVYVTGMSLAPERRQVPSLTSAIPVTERAYDAEQQKYLNTEGQRYIVDRYMPVPYNLTFNVDIWTSNLDQKEQLVEQIMVLYNGMIDIQTSNNALDWSIMTVLEPTNIVWSSRTIPIGTDNPIDVYSVEFKLPIFINPPAKIQIQKLIEEIVINLNTGVHDPVTMEWSVDDLMQTTVVTPGDSSISVVFATANQYELILENRGGSNIDEQILPTKIVGSKNPILYPSSVFKLNGYSITVPNNSIDDLVAAVRLQTQDTNINILFNLNKQIEIWNYTGGDIVLENIVGNQLEALGFVPTVYQGGKLAWWRLLEKYGTVTEYNQNNSNASQIRLLSTNNIEDRTNDIVGYIQYHPTDQNKLYWFPDQNTWPSATLDPISAVINPTKVFPNNELPPPTFGQRYLILDQISLDTTAWGKIRGIDASQVTWVRTIDNTTIIIQDLNDTIQNTDGFAHSVMTSGDVVSIVHSIKLYDSASKLYTVYLDQPISTDNSGQSVSLQRVPNINDILQYDGTQWYVVFDSINTTTQHYVMNMFSGKWLTFVNNTWDNFPHSGYAPGYWRVKL